MNYKFSVVMPLYNVGDYMKETVDSVINQTIGFKDNIQLIFVDDGSTDNTAQICNEYKSAYPDNVTYVYQENAGPSAARNSGMPHIQGKYTNFLDGDDIWDLNAFEMAWDMFERSDDSIDIVTCRSCYFEEKTGYTALDFKFADGDMICDINEHPSYCQFSVTTAFCRSSAITDLSFDTRLTYGEDAKFINELLLKKEKYGLIRNSEYHIRKRSTETSLTQTKVSNFSSYLTTATLYYKYMIDYSVEKYGTVIPYVQYAVINAIKYRVGTEIPADIPDSVREPYIDLLIELLSYIDDPVICKTNNITIETRIYLLILKYGSIEKLKKLISVRKNAFNINGVRIGRVLGKKALKIESIRKGLFHTDISGTIRCPLVAEDISLSVRSADKEISNTVNYAPDKCRRSFNNESMNKIFDFSVRIPRGTDPSDLEWSVTSNGSTVLLEPVLPESN